MRNRVLLVLLTVTLAVSLVLFSACPAPPEETTTPPPPPPNGETTTPPPPPEAKILKIGALDALTGFMAPGEAPQNEGRLLFVDWINDNGGITINGQPYLIDLVTEDTKSTGEGVIAAATKLSGQGIKFFVGGIATHENVAANSVLIPAGLIRISNYNCLNPGEMSPETPQTFAGSTAAGGLRPLLDYVKEVDPSAKTIAWVCPLDGGTADRVRVFDPIAEEKGFEVIYYAEYNLETEDFTPIVQKALDSGADVFFAFDGWPYHIGGIVKTARTLGYTGPLFSTPPNNIRDVIAIAGVEAAEGYFGASWDVYSPEMPPVMQEIVARSEAFTGGEANYWHSFGWLTCWALTQAIESAQSLDPVVVAEHWKTMTTIETVSGTGTMGGQQTFGINSVVCSPLWIVKVENGELVTVKSFGTNHTP
jgi:branched-chain amino acid transport system substrate-binding protein